MGDFFNWFKSGDNLKGLGTIIGGIGGAYGNIQQAKYAKNLINLQKSAYQRGIKKQDNAQKAMVDGFDNSPLYDKKRQLVRL